MAATERIGGSLRNLADNQERSVPDSERTARSPRVLADQLHDPSTDHEYIGTLLGGRYEVREQIGAGFYATVYAVHDNRSDTVTNRKKVAKVIPFDELSTDLVSEGKLLMEMKHPNIVKLYDTVYQDARLFLITEYCDGGDLSSAIRRERSNKSNFPEPTVLKWMFQLLQGLKFIHAKNIIHRDIKPRNILIHEGNLKVGDFGMSRVLSESERVDSLVGSCAYMSPEVVNSEGYVQKSDIWSVGCVLYELVALTRAFSASNVVHLFNKIMNEPPPDWPTGYSKQLERMFRRALSKNVYKRPTAEAMLKMPVLRRHTTEAGDFEYRERHPLEISRDESLGTSQEESDTGSQGSYVDSDQSFLHPGVMLKSGRGATSDRVEIPTSHSTKSLTVDVEQNSSVLSRSAPGNHKHRNVKKLSWMGGDEISVFEVSLGNDEVPGPTKSKSYPQIFGLEDSADIGPHAASEHVINFIVRQKEDDMECIYIDCVLKDDVASRLEELQDLGYNRGPRRSKDIVVQDKSVIRVSTTGSIRLSMDGSDSCDFEMFFDSERDSAGEEGWVTAESGDDVFKYKGFVTFSVSSSTLCSRERHRSSSGLSDTISVVLCALPLSVKTLNPEVEVQTVETTQSRSTDVSSMKFDKRHQDLRDMLKPDFWNPIVSIVSTLRTEDWVKLGQQLEYKPANLSRFQADDVDGSEALANLLMDYFRRRRDSADTISKLSEAMRSLGYKDTANVLIQRDQSAEEEWKFKKVVHELSEDALLLRDHKHFLRMLGLSEANIEETIHDRTLSLKEIVRTGVYLWRSSTSGSSINDIVKCLNTTGHKRLAEDISVQFLEK